MSDSPEFDDTATLPFAGVSDFHCHCDFSVDAVGSVDDYCRAALKRGLAEICFTTHYDTNYAINYSDNYIRIDGYIRRQKFINEYPGGFLSIDCKIQDEYKIYNLIKSIHHHPNFILWPPC